MKTDEWKRKKGRAVAAFAAVFLVYTAVTVILTWPLVKNPNRYYFSAEVPGDGIGTIAADWYSAHAEEADMEGPVTRFYAYPFGSDRRGTPQYPLAAGLGNQLSRIIGAQPAYNALVFFSFPMAGIFMFALILYLTGSYAASFLGGFIYAFSPWHTARAFDQVSLTAIYTLPLFLLALIVFTKRRDVISALGLAAAWIIAFYTDFHFGLFTGFMALCWLAVVALQAWRGKGAGGWILSGGKPGWRRTVLLMTMVVVLTAAANAPYISEVFYKDPKVFPGSQRGGVEETTKFSADLWNYVIPPAHAVTWRWFTNDFVPPRLGSRTSNEVTSYPGIVTVALAVAALYLTLRRKRDATSEAEDTSRRGPLRTTVIFCAILVVAAGVLSLPPQYKLGGLKIPTPSMLVVYLVPIFRYFARWAIVVTFGLCLLAGIGFYALTSSRGWGRRAIWSVCIAAVLLFTVDVSIVPPLRAHDISRPPEIIKRLAAYPKDEAVAIYPLAQGSEYATLHYFYLQQFHGHPMLNGIKGSTESDLYRLALKDIYSPYTPRMLRALGIDKVVVLNGYFASKAYGNYPTGVPFDPQKMPDGYELADKTSDGYIYNVVAEPADVFPLYWSNFTAPSVLEDGRAWAVMVRPQGEILLVNRGGKAVYSFVITVVNPGEQGNLTFSLDGREVSSVALQSGARRVVLPGLELTGGRHTLKLQWDGKPKSVSGDPFRSAGDLDAYLLVSSPEVLKGQ
jgi:hypothetical protein